MLPSREVGDKASSSWSPSHSSSSSLHSLSNQSPNFHRNQNLFPGESWVCRQSPRNFSNGLCSKDDSSQFVSPPLDGMMTNCEYFSRLNIGEEEEVKKTHYPYVPYDDGFRYGVYPESTSDPFIPDISYYVPPNFHHKNSVRTLFDHQGSSIRSKSDEIKGRVHLMAKTHFGCKYLQTIIENGTSLDVTNIITEVIPHVVELMVDPFGNYLMQKLLDVCNEEQRNQIILKVTAVPGQLIGISLNAYGTRVVQRLLKSIKYCRDQLNMVKSALRPGFCNLMKDINGNHVIQCCLQNLRAQDNEFIFDDAARFCIDLGAHRHACHMLQKCITYSIGPNRDKLITEISRNSLFLAQDPYGNYTIQYILELRDISAIYIVLAHLRGHYVELSMQKFSSHMVEHCLKICPESHLQIVLELISVPHFDLLIQHPYANYVIKAALDVTEGSLHARLVELIMPHWNLRNNPHCKRIFSGILFKK